MQFRSQKFRQDFWYYTMVWFRTIIYQPQISFNIWRTLHEKIRHNRCADHMGIQLKGSLEKGDKNVCPTCKVNFVKNTILYAVLFRFDKQSSVLCSLVFKILHMRSTSVNFVSCQRVTVKMYDFILSAIYTVPLSYAMLRYAMCY